MKKVTFMVDVDTSPKFFRPIESDGANGHADDILLADDKTIKYQISRGGLKLIVLRDETDGEWSVYFLRSRDNWVCDKSSQISDRLPEKLTDDQFAVKIKDPKHPGCVYYIVFVVVEGVITKTFEWIKTPAQKKLAKNNNAQFIWTLGPVSFETKSSIIVPLKQKMVVKPKEISFDGGIGLGGSIPSGLTEEGITYLDASKGKISMKGWDC